MSQQKEKVLLEKPYWESTLLGIDPNFLGSAFVTKETVFMDNVNIDYLDSIPFRSQIDIRNGGPLRNRFNRLYALDLLFQAKIAANTGTSSIFDAHHDGDHVCALKNRWSTRLYCTFGFHDKSLMHKAGLIR